MYTRVRNLRLLLIALALAIGFLAFSVLNPGTAMAWLHPGAETVYPGSGGKWTYGYWNGEARSYYTVNKRHGSSVNVNGRYVRSVCTASGRTSDADVYAVNTAGAHDYYYYRLC